MEFFIKIHKDVEGGVLAVCDSELIGKKLKDDKFYIDVSEKFFKGDLVSESKLVDELGKFDNVNLIGNGCVDVARKEEMIIESLVQKVENVEFCNIISV